MTVKILVETVMSEADVEGLDVFASLTTAESVRCLFEEALAMRTFLDMLTAALAGHAEAIERVGAIPELAVELRRVASIASEEVKPAMGRNAAFLASLVQCGTLTKGSMQ